ncbi:hypothetical protein OBBRIDRAFT_823797, partial [Obba rivulosa]
MYMVDLKPSLMEGREIQDELHPHELFGIIDIIYVICDMVLEYLDLHEARSTLARLARVCKAFYYPAIKTLWRRLDGLQPLMH